MHSLLAAAKLGKFCDIDNELICIFSIDGTHCPFWEPRPFSTEWSSHKYGKKPAANYELAIRLDVPKLMWVYGPTRPGKDNDLDVFRMELKQKMLDELPGCRIIAAKDTEGNLTSSAHSMSLTQERYGSLKIEHRHVMKHSIRE